MDERGPRALADNEAVFREVNEAIGRGQWPGEEDHKSAFRCECAKRECAELLAMTAREYERIRANPRRFILISGHERPDIETVVERGRDYVVVEKTGAAGREAEATDPRG